MIAHLTSVCAHLCLSFDCAMVMLVVVRWLCVVAEFPLCSGHLVGETLHGGGAGAFLVAVTDAF